jgi:hypothetical protein
MIDVHHEHRSSLHGVLQYEVMRGSLIFKACRCARGVSVVVAGLLLCLGVLLCLLFLPVSGSEGSSAPGETNMLHVDQGTIGNAPSRDGTSRPGKSLFALTNETEESDNSPVNAWLLTMLFLVASFFGVNARCLLSSAQAQGASCSSLGLVGEVLSSTCEDYLPFLGVFRL